MISMISIDAQIKCLEREAKRRRKFFPALVEKQKLTQEEATIGIVEMQAALETLTQLRGILQKGSQ